VVVDLDALPSMGSAQHGTGECKRCNFFPKGRCQNGKNCTFCHYSHDKRKPSRQEKRERRAAWMEMQGDSLDEAEHPAAGLLLSDMQPQQPGGLLLSKPLIQQGYFHPDMSMVLHEDVLHDETLAYSIFPGMPPIHATKLPAPLPLPGMEMTGPPGLVAQPWVPEVISTRSTPVSSAFLGTVPTPASSVASTPMPTPKATPTGAMLSANAEAFQPFASLAPTTATFGTQTGDYKCNKCELKGGKTAQEAETASAAANQDRQGQQYPRNELLRLRDGALKMSGGSEKSGGILFAKSTAAITAY